MALTRDGSWTEAVDGESTEWTTQVGTAVAEHASTQIPETTDHLQALPERFAEESGTIIVTGAYVGTTASGSRFDVPFTHTYELENDVLFEQPIDTGDTHENR